MDCNDGFRKFGEFLTCKIERVEGYIMIIRRMFRGIWKPGQEASGRLALEQQDSVRQLVREGVFMTAAAFAWQNNVFLYFECMEAETDPLESVQQLAPHLVDWPGEAKPRTWIPMVNVFHFNEPASKEHWLRKAPVERRAGRIAFLKREMMASYIYYHYQLQEERAFHADKYEIIAMHENLLFGYQEFPKVIEEPIVPGRLATKGTPENWEDSRMDLHFQPWEDGYLYFKPVDQIFAYYVGDE